MDTLTKKEFALSKIAPYFKNPYLCGYDDIGCNYYTEEGKVCVAGACLINVKKYKNNGTCVYSLIKDKGEKILKKDCRNKLTIDEWQFLQQLHDAIAQVNLEDTKEEIERLDLFTYKELKAYSDKLTEPK